MDAKPAPKSFAIDIVKMEPPPRPTLAELSHSWALSSIEPERGYSQPPTPRPASPAPSPSPSPMVTVPISMPTSTIGQKRPRNAKLTSDKHLILMGHVCEHRSEYTKGKIVFWKTIGSLFEEDIGIIQYILIYIYTNLYIYYRPVS